MLTNANQPGNFTCEFQANMTFSAGLRLNILV